MPDDESGPSRAATLRLLARVTALGFLLGGGGLLALVLAGRSVRTASALSFSLAALVFGFGLAAWAGALLLGPSRRAARENLDAGTGWASADTRQAMAVLAALGGGAMIGSAVVTMLMFDGW